MLAVANPPPRPLAILSPSALPGCQLGRNFTIAARKLPDPQFLSADDPTSLGVLPPFIFIFSFFFFSFFSDVNVAVSDDCAQIAPNLPSAQREGSGTGQGSRKRAISWNHG